MSRLRDVKRADALSPETTFSGLPKACKLVKAADQSASGGGAYDLQSWAALAAFNYGGYTFSLTSGLISGVYIPEPGIYEATCTLGIIANSQTMHIVMNCNNNSVMPDGSYAQAYVGATFSNGAFVPMHTMRMVAEFKTGDLLQFYGAQATGGAQNWELGYCWAYIEKRGGQY